MQRVDYLDGLRGVTAMAVPIQQHCAESIARSAAAPALFLNAICVTPFKRCSLSRFGVAPFFLFIGIVIPFSSREPQPPRRFAVTRLFRRYPAFWLSIAVALEVYASVCEQLPILSTFLANPIMAQRILGFPDTVNTHWTLGIELVFYLLCAGIYAAGGPDAAHVLAAAALLMPALTAFLNRHVPVNLQVNLSLMFTGTLSRNSWHEGGRMARRLGIVTSAQWLAGVALVQFMLVPEDATSPGVVLIAMLFGYNGAFAVFKLVLLRRQRFGQAIYWLGAVSYSVYLFHGLVPVPFNGLAQPGVEWRGPAFFALIVWWTLLLSNGVCHLLEWPMIGRGNALTPKLAELR